MAWPRHIFRDGARLLLVELGSRHVIFINSERLRRKFPGNLASVFELVRFNGAYLQLPPCVEDLAAHDGNVVVFVVSVA